MTYWTSVAQMTHIEKRNFYPYHYLKRLLNWNCVKEIWCKNLNWKKKKASKDGICVPYEIFFENQPFHYVLKHFKTRNANLLFLYHIVTRDEKDGLSNLRNQCCHRSHRNSCLRWPLRATGTGKDHHYRCLLPTIWSSKFKVSCSGWEKRSYSPVRQCKGALPPPQKKSTIARMGSSRTLSRFSSYKC